VHANGRRRLCYLEHRAPFQCLVPESSLLAFELEWVASATVRDVVWAIVARNDALTIGV
jgi:hypothetical protein